MKSLLSLILILFTVFGLTTTSCISDDFTTSSSDILSFSTDTLTFDTVFTNTGTPTARLLVYNKAKKAVNISSIKFADGESNFSMNVDGIRGEEFSNVEIMAKDSIYIFVECYIPENNDNEPYLVSDKLQFITNGILQEVEVEAYGQNVTRIKGETVTTDMRLTSERPYIVFDSLVVDNGAKLTIDPGAKVLFHDKARLVVRGTLEAIGDPDNMIDLRGDRLDKVLPGISYDILAGQWEGIVFDANSFDNHLEYVNMRSTKFGIRIDSCSNLDRQKLFIRNSWLHNSQGCVIDSKYAKVDAYGVCFSEAAEAVVRLTGGKHNFVQCTIANYYLYSVISEPLLSLYHCLPSEDDEVDLPLMEASFENSIIYGMAADINQGDLTGSNVYLKNVLLKSEGSNDDNFIDCLWNVNPLFYTEREKYIFNYRLRPDSPAIGAGNTSFINQFCLTDMDGVNRLSSGKPDLGAYVFVQPKADSRRP